MVVKQRTRRVLAGAALALATGGLGCVDLAGPTVYVSAPPRLVCTEIADGESLSPSVSRSADTLQVVVRAVGIATSGWALVSVSDLSGALMVGLQDPRPGTKAPLGLSLRSLTPTTTRITFSVAATVYGFYQDSCDVSRTFRIDTSSGEARIAAGEAGPRLNAHAIARMEALRPPRPGALPDGRRRAATPGTGAGISP